MKTNITGALVSAALAVGAPVAAEEVTDKDRFRLWSACQSVNLIVERSSGAAKTVGLTEMRIRAAVESRLRGARIFDAESLVRLYVHPALEPVTNDHGKLGVYYFVEYALYMPLTKLNVLGSLEGQVLTRQDLIEKIFMNPSGTGHVPTWSSSFIGIAGNKGADGRILQSLTEKTDEFINEYLRVNAEACE